MEARRFSHVWNEILKTFREEDLISNRFVLILVFSCLVSSCLVYMNRESHFLPSRHHFNAFCFISDNYLLGRFILCM